MYNPSTRKVIQMQDVQWAEWHGKIKAADGMNVFNSDAYGIDELISDMTEYFDTSGNKPSANLPVHPATPAHAHTQVPQEPPRLIPAVNTRLTSPATNTRTRGLPPPTQHAPITGIRAAKKKHPGAGRKPT